MQATVKILNAKSNLCAAETERGEFVIFEALDAYHVPKLEDVLTHEDFYAQGSQTYRNVTRKVDFPVYVQNTVGSLPQAKKQCAG